MLKMMFCLLTASFAINSLAQTDYEVYSKVLSEIHKDADTIVVLERKFQTDLEWFMFSIDSYLDDYENFKEACEQDSVWISLIHDLDSLKPKNFIEDTFNLNRTIEILPFETMSGYFRFDEMTDENSGQLLREGWKIFRETHPYSKGLISFSEISYSPAKTKAVLEISNYIDGLAGANHLILVKLVGSKWEIVATVLTSMS